MCELSWKGEVDDMQSIEIRPALISDASELARLMGELGYPTTPPQMQACLALLSENADYQTFVVEVENGLAGMIGVRSGMGYERDGILVQIIDLVVDERFRGKGIGKKLVECADKWAKDKNATRLIVTAAIHRTKPGQFAQVHHQDQGKAQEKEQEKVPVDNAPHM
jgi:GNAT superfamily N-acetyltransferase